MVTNTQLCLAVGIPMLVNAAFMGLLIGRAFNQRFDDLRDFWLAELHRFEGALDARLKRLE